ncbi:MAG: c-type cytochrome [Methylotenera sp.]|nr:c-type cytochrome [Oligoflexia bacterium]
MSKSDDNDPNRKKSTQDSLESQPHHLAGHTYDGIDELDNALPRWWINLFYITIVFSLGYFSYYVMGDGPTLVREWEIDRGEQEIAQLSKPAGLKSVTEDELKLVLKDSTRKLAGQAIYQSKCISCHGAHGEGGIGPNLTDDHWIHGGKMTNLVKMVTVGVLDKGMPPWGTILKQNEIHSVVAYVKSLRGTHPAGAKAPQGDLVEQ